MLNKQRSCGKVRIKEALFVRKVSSQGEFPDEEYEYEDEEVHEYTGKKENA